jgi:16S rRNA (uracil1498-N3)-methyltransferase
MGLPRFHVPEAAPGAQVTLPAHSAHHARDVLRLRAGDPVTVFDGCGAEFEALLDWVSREHVTARLSGPAPSRPESPLRITLALSPLKGDRMETVIQKATELGVHEIWPVILSRTDAVARPALSGSRQERWEKVASGAAEQCGRSVVPRIVATLTLPSLLATPFEGSRILFREGGNSLPRLGTSRDLLVLVGPAGGFEDHELERLRVAGFEERGLGPRILRAETAAIAVVTSLQVLYGDLA